MHESLCEPWPLDEGCCDFVDLGIPPAITGAAHEAASEALWLATGKQFGNCPVVFRPCRQDCYGEWPPDTLWSDSIVGTHWGYPHPALQSGVWVNLVCGSCVGDCGCSSTSVVVFPDPINSILEVTVDGVVLTPDSYILYDHQQLVRLGGEEWPLCQDWTVTGGPGAWTVTATVGAEVPALGRLAVSALTCEIAKHCVGQECALPTSVTSVTRQGVTMVTGNDFLAGGRIGLFVADLFISRYNPNGLQERARAYSPDKPLPRTQ